MIMSIMPGDVPEDDGTSKRRQQLPFSFIPPAVLQEAGCSEASESAAAAAALPPLLSAIALRGLSAGRWLTSRRSSRSSEHMNACKVASSLAYPAFVVDCWLPRLAKAWLLPPAMSAGEPLDPAVDPQLAAAIQASYESQFGSSSAPPPPPPEADAELQRVLELSRLEDDSRSAAPPAAIGGPRSSGFLAPPSHVDVEASSDRAVDGDSSRGLELPKNYTV
eukprot:s4910_g1.t1